MKAFDPPLEVQACIHSMDGKLGAAKILHDHGNNNYVAEYNGVKCSAIYNGFAGRFYVDDKYGIIKDKPAHQRSQER